ncbi:MAG: serine/threonine protein kinase [Labedaea sp.]
MTKIPGYRLEEKLGAGGMSVVYRATRIADGASVAVKVLSDRLVLGDKRYLRRLRTEAELASRVRHDGVVGIHEVGADAEDPWLAMDLVAGPDLQRLVDEGGALPAERAAAIVATVADAVSAVHRAGVVHRDLKPANILLDGDRPRIADFGIARPIGTVESSLGLGLSAGTDWSRTNGEAERSWTPGAGTVAYMAPEQWRGEEGDACTDVYALGGILYTALTGRRPVPHRSLAELAYAVGTSAPPAPSAHGAPAAFDAVVATAMAKDPKERYPDAAAFAAAVRRAAAGRPPRTRAAGRAWSPRRTWLAAGAAAVAVLIACAGLLIWRPWQPEPDPADKVVCARDLDVRDQPRSRTVVMTLYRDQRVRMYRDTPQRGWARVELPDGRSGWVLTQYLGPPC